MTEKKNIVIDATVFNTFLNCEQLTDFEFNRNFRPIAGKSNSLEAGTIVHKILEVYYQTLIKGFPRKTAISNGMVAGELFYLGCIDCKNETGACGHKPREYLGTQNIPLENEKEPFKRTGYKWIVETMEQYFDFYQNDSWIPLQSEKVLGKVLYEDDEIRILWKAKIDVLVDTNQGIHPMDHKTMGQDRKEGELNNQFIGQCLVSGTNRVYVNKIGFQTSLKPEKKFKRVLMTYSMDTLHEWQAETLPRHMYNYLNCFETEYWPRRHTYCDNKYGKCSFYEVCRVDSQFREDELRNRFIVGEEWDPSNV